MEKEGRFERVLSGEDILTIFASALRMKREDQFVSLMQKESSKYWKVLLQKGDLRLLSLLLEHSVWKKSFEADISSHLRLLKGNDNVNSRQLVEKYDRENDNKITRFVFRSGGKKDL